MIEACSVAFGRVYFAVQESVGKVSVTVVRCRSVHGFPDPLLVIEPPSHAHGFEAPHVIRSDPEEIAYEPGFPIWLWYFDPSEQSPRLDCRGFCMRHPARMGDTQWVNDKPRHFSSCSTGF